MAPGSNWCKAGAAPPSLGSGLLPLASPALAPASRGHKIGLLWLAARWLCDVLASLLQSPGVRLPLLITGVAGVAGYNALDYFQRRFPGQVIGIRQRDNWRLDRPGVVACNAEDREGLGELFETHRFASVLDCAGNCASRRASLIRRWPGGSTSREFTT